MASKTLIYFIEGNIGAGKTTILNKLKTMLPNNKYNIITEPIKNYRNLKIYNSNEVKNTLDDFYNNKLSGFEFQIYVSQILMEHILTNIEINKINIIERSVFTAVSCFSKNLYNNKKISSYQFSILKNLENLFVSILNHQFYFIYLNVKPDICLKRIVKRNRPEELNISLEYLTNLHDCHENMIKELKDNKFRIKEINSIEEVSIDELFNLIQNIIETNI